MTYSKQDQDLILATLSAVHADALAKVIRSDAALHMALPMLFEAARAQERAYLARAEPLQIEYLAPVYSRYLLGDVAEAYAAATIQPVAIVTHDIRTHVLMTADHYAGLLASNVALRGG